MISLQDNLKKIGINPGTSVSYKSFFSRPASLREVIRSMDAPKQWEQVSDISRDEYWTDEVQGVAWDGENWIFSCNANQIKPGAMSKAIYTFPGGSKLHDNDWKSVLNYQNALPPILRANEDNHHWGQVCYYNGRVYVSHFWHEDKSKAGSAVVIFKDQGGYLSFDCWIDLGQVTSSDGSRTEYPEFQAINPWDGQFYTCLGGGYVSEFFIHDPKTGDWQKEKKILSLKGALPNRVQGACFSPNGHLYVAIDAHIDGLYIPWKVIYYYSALNGMYLGVISIYAEGADQELEGICYGSVNSDNGQTAQIHAILLENREPPAHFALDNIFFKSFRADKPDAV